MQWDIAYMQLEKAETTFEAAGLLERPEHSLRCCGCTGKSCLLLSFVPVSSFSARAIPTGSMHCGTYTCE